MQNLIPAAEPALCRNCGTTLPGGEWSGGCPRCLIEAFVADEEADSGGALVPGYTILEEIARGGMGVVYQAQQHHPRRIVALKMILPHLLGSAVVRARFQAEAELVAKLDHPNVLPIYEAGENHGIPYLAMKFVAGGSVATHSAKFRGAPKDCARLLAAVSRGVHHAHARGILHRDLKPANLLLDASSPDAAAVPMVSDFGLARILEAEPSGLTVPSAVLGTAGYLAPELACGGESAPTVQADIYSLGAILYELLAGQLPFGAGSGIKALRRADEETPPALRTLNPGIPKDLDAICLTCLQREPSSRYRSAAALADDLERFLAGHPVVARPVPRLLRLTRWARRKPALAALSVAIVLLFATALGGTALFSQRVARERDRAAASEKEAQAQLWRAYLEQARAIRIAPQMGRRFGTLDAVAAAARLRPSLELRNVAAAALALEDIVLEHRWPRMRMSIDTPVVFDAKLERYALPVPGRRISVRRMSDNVELHNLAGAAGTEVAGLAWSPDGHYLATNFETGEIWMWRLGSAAPELVLQLDGAPVPRELAFSAASDLFAATTRPHDLVLYDLTGAAPREMTRWTDLPAVRGLRFDPAGRRLAITSIADKVAEIRETATGRLLQRWPHPGAVTGADWSPDGSTLATASHDFRVRIWDAHTGALAHTLEAHHNAAVRPLYHPAGRVLITAGWDAVLRFWSARSGELLFNGPACYDWQRFSTDGTQLAVANYDGAVELYRFAPTTAVRIFAPATPKSLPTRFLSADFSPDSRRLVSTGTECAHIWDVASGVKTAHIPLPGAFKLRSLFGADGRSLWMVDADSGITRWPLVATGAAVDQEVTPEIIRTGEGWETTSPPVGDRYVIVNRELGVAEIFSPQEPAGRRVGPHPGIHSAALSPDGTRLATGTWLGHDIKIWDIGRNELLATIPAGESNYVLWPSADVIIAVQMNEAAQWIAGPDRQWRRERVWKPEPGQTFWLFAALNAGRGYLALPQSGDRVRLISLRTGDELITLEPPKGFGLGFVRFSPDGRYLAAHGSRERVAVWDLPELRRELTPLRLDWAE